MTTLERLLKSAFTGTVFSVRKDNDTYFPDTCGYIFYNNNKAIAEYNESEIKVDDDTTEYQVYKDTTEDQVLLMAKILMIYAGPLIPSLQEQILTALKGIIVSDNLGYIADKRFENDFTHHKRNLNQIQYKNQEPLRF